MLVKYKIFFLALIAILPVLGLQKKENIEDFVSFFYSLPKSERDCFALSSGEARHFEVKVGKGIKILAALKIYKNKKWIEVDISNSPGAIKEFYEGDKKEYWYAFVGEPGNFNFVEITRDAYDIMQSRHNASKFVCPDIGSENCAEKCTRWLCDCLKGNDSKKLCSDKHISCIDNNCKIKHYGTSHKNRASMSKDKFPRKIAIINLSSYRTEFCIGHEGIVALFNKATKKVGQVLGKFATSTQKGAVKVAKSAGTVSEIFRESCKCVGQFLQVAAKNSISAECFLDIIDSCLSRLRYLGIEACDKFIAGVTKPIRDILKISLKTAKQAPLSTGVSNLNLKCKEVSVRASKDPINSKERLFREKRDLFVRDAQKKLLGINQPLTIAVAGSGGGLRATLGYLGHMLALKESGLLDIVTYASALSGSSWLLSGWLQKNQSLEQYKDILINRIIGSENILGLLQDMAQSDKLYSKEAIESLIESSGIFKDIIDNIVTKWAFAEPYNIVDVYGSLLGWLTLPHKHGIQRQYLSKQREQINNGQNLMPIYTAQWYKSNFDRAVVEFTPYEIGSRDWKAFIDCNGFGRKYLNGKSSNCSPPQSVGFLQGIWGSAFAARASDFWNHFLKEKVPILLRNNFYDPSSGVDSYIQSLLNSKLGEFQFVRGGDIRNFMKGLSGSSITEDKILLIDNGIGWMNNPIFSLYRDNQGKKASDIIFMFDYQVASKDNNLKKIKALYSNEFNMLTKYAKTNQLSLPKLDVNKLISSEKDSKGNLISKINTMTIFQDENDLSKPIIIFLPLVGAYSDNYNTFKFNYSKNEAENLVNLSKNNLMKNLEEIKEVIKKRAIKLAGARDIVN